MEYQGINHLVSVTDDMEKTVRFSRDVLGIRVAATLAERWAASGCVITSSAWDLAPVGRSSNGRT